MDSFDREISVRVSARRPRSSPGFDFLLAPWVFRCTSREPSNARFDRKCMTDINVADVVSAITQMLSRPRGPLATKTVGIVIDSDHPMQQPPTGTLKSGQISLRSEEIPAMTWKAALARVESCPEPLRYGADCNSDFWHPMSNWGNSLQWEIWRLFRRRFSKAFTAPATARRNSPPISRS